MTRPQISRPADRERIALGVGTTWEGAFTVSAATVGRLRAQSGAATDWHTQDRDVYGYVQTGPVLLEYGPSEVYSRRVDGESFFYLPAGLTYRIVNLTDDESIVALALVGDADGEPFTSASDVTQTAPTTKPTDTPRFAGPDDLTETASLANLVRRMPFPDARVQQVRGHADGKIESEWHHHGDNDVFGYVLAGEGYVDVGEAENPRARTDDFFYVPADLVHRDVNPTEDPQDYVLWLTGSEPRMVYADAP